MPERHVYFDTRVMLGPGDWTGPHQPVTVEAITSAMDHFGIHEALVIDSVGEIADSEWANQRIVEHTEGHPRLHPVWVVVPPQSRELPSPRDMVAQMREQAVAAVWLPYGAFDLPLDAWCVDPLLEPLAEARVPVFACPIDRRLGNRDDATDWAGVVGLCQRFPELPVVVTEARIYKSQRAMCAALEACPNLSIDISALWLHRMVEFLCRESGADRLVWGSQLPYRSPAAPIMQLSYAEISEEERAQIAGGNILRLISWNGSVRSTAADVSFPPPVDRLHHAARERCGLSGERFYDCHGHVGGRGQRHVIRSSASELVREMDLLGVEVCCVFTFMGLGDLADANERTFRTVEEFPDRFVGFTALNPNHGEEEMRRELARGLARGMRGVKLVNSIHGYPEDGPLIDVACEFAHEHRQLILNHVWGSAETMGRLCRNYPNACFITGHSEPGFGQLTAEFPNLYICSCPFLGWGQTEEFVGRYGADRILFGSDLHDLPISWGMGPILYAQIPESDKRLILGDNLKRLLHAHAM